MVSKSWTQLKRLNTYASLNPFILSILHKSIVSWSKRHKSCLLWSLLWVTCLWGFHTYETSLFFFPLICLKSISLFLQNFHLFIFGCAASSLLCGLFSSCSEQELLSSCSVWASHCGVFSCCRAWALGGVGFSSCSTWTQFLHSMWGSSGTRDRTSVPSIVRKILNHRTISEVIISLTKPVKELRGKKGKVFLPYQSLCFHLDKGNYIWYSKAWVQMCCNAHLWVSQLSGLSEPAHDTSVRNYRWEIRLPECEVYSSGLGQ